MDINIKQFFFFLPFLFFFPKGICIHTYKHLMHVRKNEHLHPSKHKAAKEKKSGHKDKISK